jgi:hypothetical protein
MRLSKSKLLTGAAILGLAIMAGPVNAAVFTDNADVDITIDTLSGITAADGATMDFGDWLIGVAAADTASIVMATDGTYTINEGATSQLVELGGNASGTAGTVTVDLPAGADEVELQMERGAITDFADAALTLSDITYATATEGDDIPLAEATPVVVTVDTGGTPETVSFGATITASNASPANGTHTATFNVVFSY